MIPIDIFWLVVEPTPLKNMTSSVGMMTFPIYGKHVPNHQPVLQYGVTTLNSCRLLQYVTVTCLVI